MQFLQNIFKAPPKPTADEIQQRLRVAFDFTDADLQTNYEGKMSRHQHYWLVDRLLRRTLICIGVGVVAAYVFINFRSDSVNSIVAGIVFFAAAIYGLGNFWMMGLDLIYKNVESISGEVHLGVHGRGNLTYTLNIVQLRFDIDKKNSHAVVNGETYTVYYAPRSKVILAAEVHKTKNDEQAE
jgi:hypothetical protein